MDDRRMERHGKLEKRCDSFHSSWRVTQDRLGCCEFQRRSFWLGCAVSEMHTCPQAARLHPYLQRKQSDSHGLDEVLDSLQQVAKKYMLTKYWGKMVSKRTLKTNLDQIEKFGTFIITFLHEHHIIHPNMTLNKISVYSWSTQKPFINTRGTIIFMDSGKRTMKNS